MVQDHDWRRQFAVCGRELDAVALGEIAADLAVCGDPAQAFRVVGDLLPSSLETVSRFAAASTEATVA